MKRRNCGDIFEKNVFRVSKSRVNEAKNGRNCLLFCECLLLD